MKKIIFLLILICSPICPIEHHKKRRALPAVASFAIVGGIVFATLIAAGGIGAYIAITIKDAENEGKSK